MSAALAKKIAEMPADQREIVLRLLKVTAQRKRAPFKLLFPDETIVLEDGTTYHARRLYPKQLEVFKATATYRETCMMSANQVGKTTAGAYATTCHLTGIYPAWWEGKRFAKPVDGWAAGKSFETTRDIVQKALLGRASTEGGRKFLDGTGMVPSHLIRRQSVRWKSGVDDLVDTCRVQHVTGGYSILGLKAYAQGRGSFEGTTKDFVWIDEEPPMDVYGEILIRLATTKGILLLTFTPLEGMSEVAIQFLPKEMRPHVDEPKAERYRIDDDQDQVRRG